MGVLQNRWLHIPSALVFVRWLAAFVSLRFDAKFTKETFAGTEKNRRVCDIPVVCFEFENQSEFVSVEEGDVVCEPSEKVMTLRQMDSSCNWKVHGPAHLGGRGQGCDMGLCLTHS